MSDGRRRNRSKTTESSSSSGSNGQRQRARQDTRGSSQGGGNKNRKRRSRRRGRRRGRNDRNRGGGQRQEQGVGFWGDASRLPEPRTDVRMTDDPAAVARSLGQPPLPGHEAMSAHYFAAVYDRAVATAGALAAAGGLIDPDALNEDAEERPSRA